ncbi:MAG: sugar transferase [Candidatus Binatia bacterium]
MTPRILAFAMVEMGSLLCVSCGTLLLWREISIRNSQEILALVGQTFILPFCFFTAFYASDLYNVRFIKNFFEFRKRLVKPLVFVFVLLAFFLLFMPAPRLFPSSAILSSLLPVLLGAVIVLVLRWGLYTFGSIGPFTERILVLGAGELAGKVATAVRSIAPLGYLIAGFVDDNEAEESGASSPRSLSPILGPLSRIEQIIEQFQPDRIIVALRERRGRMPLSTLLRVHWAGVVVEDGIQIHERFSGKIAVESLTPGFLIFATDFKKPRVEAFLRRGISLIVAAVGLILTAPLFMLIAIAIKLDSKGAVFFLQERAGLNGRIFRLVKFRTMYSTHSTLVPEEPEPVWDRDLDSRITRVGGWLRKTHLDELPQFFNILRGDMDLVGPRPEMADNIKTMTEQIPYYALRMAVRPGVTGWAQVKSGYAVNQEEVTEKIRYDLYYIKHRSLWLDFHIIIDTVKLILFGQSRSSSPFTMTEQPDKETRVTTQSHTISSKIPESTRPTHDVRAA